MKLNSERISIGMPAYNGEKHIEQSITSLLKQTHTNFELIISDDASSDRTEEICQRFAQQDKRIRYIRQTKNLGFLKNFNFVMEQATGKYFLWAGNDDYWDERYLEKLYSLFQDYPKTVLAVSKFNNVHNNKPYNYIANQKIENGRPQLDYLNHFLKTRNLSYFYGLHKTECIRGVGGYHADSRPFFKSSDFLTIFRVLLNGPMSYTDEVLFFKRDTGHYTNQFALVKSLQFNPQVIKKILRYLCFPLFFLYDLFFSSWFTVQSQLNVSTKIRLLGYLFLAFIQYNGEYFLKIAQGIFSLLAGLTEKVSLRHAKS